MTEQEAITVEEELQAITKVKPRRDSEEAGGSSRAGYLQRLMDVIAGIPEDQWTELSLAAQTWYNEGAKAIKAQKPIPDFDDVSTSEEQEPEDTVEEDMADAELQEDTTTKAKKKKGARSSTPKPKKAKGTNSGVATEGKSAIPLKADAVKVRIKRAILKDPTISLEDLCNQLSKGGTKISKVTTAGVRSEFRHSLRVLQQEGLIKIDF
jgi:hypothetical protein